MISAVQEERGPRKRRTTNETSDKLFVGSELAIGSAMSITDSIASKFHYQFLSQILITCIKQAKLNENFRLFSGQQQKFILSHVWSECFVLRASHWSIDITPIIEQYDIEFTAITLSPIILFFSNITRADVTSQL